ncbi:hypothetical protein [Streptomyces sp. NPDC017993]|uniref:hypothetical protein n=1 Tax=Streptomyces sp. NPDC017993 TaxID=3365027 RepID=UPI0037ADA79F
MTVKVIEGRGTTACPAGFYALYEGSGYNEAAPECRRVLIAGESVPDHGPTPSTPRPTPW